MSKCIIYFNRNEESVSIRKRSLFENSFYIKSKIWIILIIYILPSLKYHKRVNMSQSLNANKNPLNPHSGTAEKYLFIASLNLTMVQQRSICL